MSTQSSTTSSSSEQHLPLQPFRPRPPPTATWTMPIPVDNPWHGLTSQQRDAICEFIDEHSQFMKPAGTFSIFCKNRIKNEVFRGWDPKVKPEVPVVSHPQVEALFFHTFRAKGDKIADQSSQETERPNKVRRTSGADDVSQVCASHAYHSYIHVNPD